MTIIHIDKTTVENTIWFDHHLKFTYISIISCNFVNNMMNLSSEGTISDTEGNILLRIPKGNYSTISQIKTILDKAMHLGEKPVKIEKDKLIVNQAINLNKPLAELLGLETSLEAKSKNSINLTNTKLNGIYIHCSIIDKNKVLLNNKDSQVLVYIPINDGTISYNPKKIYIPTINESFNNIKFWVTDATDKLINGLYPMHIVIELI